MTYAVTLPETATFEAWRDAARRAISHAIAPQDLDWTGDHGLFDAAPLPTAPGPYEVRSRKDFLPLARTVIWHKSPACFGLLYQALWRMSRRDGDPLSQADPLGRQLHLMSRAVRRDIHKMHAFVRFRELPVTGSRRSFAAWFEPEHNTLEPGSTFFARRFADMDWLIATPSLSARFHDGTLTFHPGGPRPALPDDAAETLWASYFTNIFNPARIKLNAMRSEMPKKYWKNLPETRLIPEMLADAEARVERMRAAGASDPRQGAAPVSTRYRSAMPKAIELPDTLDQARQAAMQCRRCNLCEAATQTVWGEGPTDARVMIVGEQPGDHEDLQGRPFVGPAGQLLRQTMQQAGLDDAQVWLTNAVKHFKFAAQGKRRLHRNPDRGEIRHCRWWLGLELRFIQPKITLALGASAAFALTDNDGPMNQRVGKVETGLHGGPVLVSWHPAYILRLPDAGLRRDALHQLTCDMASLSRQFAG